MEILLKAVLNRERFFYDYTHKNRIFVSQPYDRSKRSYGLTILMMETLLSKLNTKQREAVEFCDGPSLIIAGRSGKTARAYLQNCLFAEQGLPPYYILALTFTNKAAREMKSRIADLVGEKKARQVWMGTFHSIFSRILRNEAEKIGFTSNFTIFDSSDSTNLVRLIIKEMQLDDKIYKPGAFIIRYRGQKRIDYAQNVRAKSGNN